MIRILQAILVVIMILPMPVMGKPIGTEDRLEVAGAALVDRYFGNGDFSGISIVSKSGQVLFEYSAGFLELGKDKMPTRDSSFHIASISKTFTAAAIRKLIDQGEVALDDRLIEFLPTFPGAGEITIRHLLNHESGLPDFWSQPDIGEVSRRSNSMQQLVDWIGDKPRDHVPGAKSVYSNSGYLVLAAVVEAVSGMSYYGFLDEQVMRPAGLAHTGRYATDADASGYQPSFGASRVSPPAAYDPSLLIGSGSLKSTAADLLAWCDKFNEDFNDAGTAPFLYGWGVRQSEDRRWVQQTGRNPGFAAHIRAYPDSETCIILLSNIESEAVAELGAGLAALAFGEELQPPALRAVARLPAEKLAGYVGYYDAGPGNRLEVRLVNDGLELRGGAGAFLPLEPIGGDRFFYRQLNVEVIGQRDASGAVSALLWDGKYPLPRIGY